MSKFELNSDGFACVRSGVEELTQLICNFLFSTREEVGKVTKEKSCTHVKDIISYLRLNPEDLVSIYSLLRRYMAVKGHAIKDVLAAAEVFHWTVYADRSVSQDVNIGSVFWQHVTAKDFSKFYEEALSFCSVLEWQLVTRENEFNKVVEDLNLGYPMSPVAEVAMDFEGVLQRSNSEATNLAKALLINNVGAHGRPYSAPCLDLPC